MASVHVQNSLDSDSSGSEPSDIQSAQSNLHQDENQHGTERSDQTESISDDSTNEISGFSHTDPSGNDYATGETDPFNSIFYHIIPSKDSTDIIFYTKPLFNTIISVLDKEFQIPKDNSKKFSVKTYVDGKRCNIHVDKTVLTISLNGPGHISWRDNNFRKLTLHMFKNFVDETNSVLKSKSDSHLNATCNTANKNDSTISSNHAEAVQPPILEKLETTMATDSPLMRNISALMDMIHTLQGQVSTLTSELNKLVLHTSSSLYQTVDETVDKTVDETNISQTNEQSYNDAQNQDNFSQTGEQSHNVVQNLDNLEAKITQDNPLSRKELRNRSNEGQTQKGRIVSSTQRLTSTPRPNRHQQSQRPRPSPSFEHHLSTRSRPVPKPRTSIQSQTGLKKILLIGDSIVSGINQNGLRKNVYKQGISGATIDSLLNEIEVFDLRQFSHIVIYIGGNDASNRTDIEYFEEKYEQLLSHIKQNSQCTVLLVNVCPRGDTDTMEVNDVISRLSEHHNMELIDAFDAFYNKYGEKIDRYYSRDSIHLSDSGVKRLLGTINSKLDIVHDFSYCVFSKPSNGRYRRTTPIQSKRTQYSNHGNGKKLQCNKCGENNHETRSCKHKEQLKCYDCGYYGHKSIRCGNQ